MGWPPMSSGESAVPNEFVPGLAALLPNAPPVIDIACDPMPPRANAIVLGSTTQATMQTICKGFIFRLLDRFRTKPLLGGVTRVARSHGLFSFSPMTIPCRAKNGTLDLRERLTLDLAHPFAGNR